MTPSTSPAIERAGSRPVISRDGGAGPGPSERGHMVVESPIGPLTLVASAGCLVGLYMDVPGHNPGPEILGEPACADPRTGLLARAAVQLGRYFAGELDAFDLPVRLAGTSFQRRVWEQLRAIPYGETISYGELARRIGQPSASRAVGLANGRNPVSIVVPCHRVIGASGGLTGYGGGLNRKRFLLALESRGHAGPAALW